MRNIGKTMSTTEEDYSVIQRPSYKTSCSKKGYLLPIVLPNGNVFKYVSVSKRIYEEYKSKSI
tara:strand:+ start:5709 stop:5897 length:189 start_codon:yes stop_codon:yes gene_type:complete